MTNPDFLRALIAPYGPAAPLETLVVELNRLYHSFEAKEYDRTHPEVHDQLPPLWSEMIRLVRSHCPDRSWNVLDFGCGTGFEAVQALEGFGNSGIRSVTCYDPSPEMLALCRSKVGTRFPRARFCSTISEVLDTREEFDLLITNSLLHHLPCPKSEIRLLDPIIRKDAWWLLGHEPSKRFYRNPECYREFRQYRQSVAWRKATSSTVYWNRLKVMTGLKINPAQAAASAAFEAGLFARKPSSSAVGRLVDFNVPHSSEEAHAGRGFDVRDLAQDFDSLWNLRWVRTYAFMACFPESGLPQRWRERCNRLAAKHPLDGANFCSAWSHA